MSVFPRIPIMAAALFAPVMTAMAAPESPKVSVAVVKNAVATDTGQSHRTLRARMLCDRPGALTGHYLGLSQATVDTRFHVRVYAQRTADGVAGGLASVTVDLRLKNRTVYVASELPEESCAYRRTLDHEMRHVAIDDAIVERFKPRLEKALTDIATTLSGIERASRAALLRAVRRPLRAVLRREMRALEHQRRMQHAAFDTGEGRDRPTESCPVPAQHFLERTRAETGSWHTPVDCNETPPRPERP